MEEKKRRGRPPKAKEPEVEEVETEEPEEEPREIGEMERRFGIKPGEQVPLHVANIMTREAQAAEKALKESVLGVATGALEDAFADQEQPRSGKRQMKNLRAPAKKDDK